MRITIKQLKARKRWRVEYRLNGVRYRPVFKTKALAEAEQERISGEVSDSGSAWIALPASERTDIMTVVREIKAAGLTLRAVWEDHRRGAVAKGMIEQTLDDAFKKFMQERKQSLVSRDTLAALNSNVGRFVTPRAKMQVSAPSRQDVMDYLAPFKGSTFNSYLTSLNTFFRWCVKLKFRAENPAASIEKIDRRRMDNFDEPPKVLHYDQCLALFKATVETDIGLIRYTAMCLQAGLRPEREAPGVAPSDIADKIHVRGKRAKTRQQRYVELVPALKQWLALPCPGAQQGPFVGSWPVKNLRRRFEAVRAKAGLLTLEAKTRPKKRGKGTVIVDYVVTDTKWGQDIMRHTFASAFYAVYGAERTIEALGHGDYDMLFSHYRRLMTKEEGQRILSICPADVFNPPGCSEPRR